MSKKEFFRAIGVKILPPLGFLLMRFFWFTSRKSFHIQGEISQNQAVVVCWHGELLISPQIYRKYHKKQKSSGIISRHFDGEIIARILQIFDIEPLRGSSSKGAKQVLLESFRALKRGDDLLVTPDGPRGPRHKIGDGAIALAMKSKAPIFAVNYKPKSYWQLNSWDRFVIPKPFTHIECYIKVLSVDGLDIDSAKEYLQAKMLEDSVI